MNDHENFENQEPQGGAPSGGPVKDSSPSGENRDSGQDGQFQGWHSYSGSDQQSGYQNSQNTGGFQNFSAGSGQNGGQQPYSQGNYSQGNYSQENYSRGTEYQWNFEDYDQISKGPGGVKTKSNTGLKIFAVVITIVFLLTVAAFAGFIVYQQSSATDTLDSGASNTAEEPSASSGPQLSLNNRPAPDEEEYTDGVLSTEEIAAKVRPSVVGIVAYQSTTYPMQTYSTGSGIIMSSDGYIITNAHVVNGAAGGIVVVLDNDEEYEAELVGIDEKTDIAVVKIEAENVTAAVICNSDEMVVGERIVAIGNPTGLNLAGSVTQGIVSGLERSIQVEDETTGTVIEMQAIQVDAAINPGNSGGALINKYGQVVGINSSKLSSTQIEGIGFAIPISTAKPIVDDLISYGYVRGRVLLGITYIAISDVTGAISGYTPGLWVQSVNEDLDVAAKGVQPGDVIVQMDDQDVRDSDDVDAVMEGKSPGDTVKLQIVRTSVTGNTTTFTVEVELAEDRGSYNSSSSQESSQSQGGLQQLPIN